MVKKDRQQSFSEYLDEEKNDKIFVRYVFKRDYSEIEEFAVIYLTIVDGKTQEVVRYDCAEDEAVHVHHFFYTPSKKRYLNKSKSFETLEYFIEMVKKHWLDYRSKFLEK